MNCAECDRLERLFLESVTFADRAQTAMRCFLTTHPHVGGVSDMDEYMALRAEERKTMDRRHDAVLTLSHHFMDHGMVTKESDLLSHA